ncbi:hypothetical protein A2767_02880 [Candidatus Roizmanbacteria bacterium RIFCSPHIGHO2_01_FULL_35_10]|uniref:PIN domain-containing protein n=1 Tax=Candidatus Roizmanbacteria bacterium RIFCSPLOWO2_01_FULL_35_13 TaxID=1802055 RepID=A0A1F7ICR9_9BACT|nr:MAG: hypothetical protein A2767_02880 [Candidatus Roizmanbacteria bacterium RIFCSPHIGHO2_01_FULL_35_10]OGK41168.1 MAG: hypothetical protein A3A74_02400 [Candidatus Roizmanbacteria bacterium RIFCSPLOWO2_01_FULL_35_13]
MKKILIDTDILINYSHGYNKELVGLLERQENNKIQLYINPIITAEFLNDKKLKNKNQSINIEEFLSLFSTANVNKETGIIAGKLLRENQIPFLADAFIAATGLQFGLELYTNNRKHFKNIKELRLFTP